MTSREIVLRRIRDALGPSPSVPDVPRGYATSGDLDHGATVERFAERVDDYRANVHQTVRAQLPATLAAIIADLDATSIGVPDGIEAGWLAELANHLEIVRDSPGMDWAVLDRLDAVVTGSAVGIADTGTIVLDASADQGRRALTLVPDRHVCVIETQDIFGTIPEGIARIQPTRPLTMISVPSATSDIELDRVEGVHGPHTLHVVIVHDDLVEAGTSNPGNPVPDHTTL